jgi:hypothetical protein
MFIVALLEIQPRRREISYNQCTFIFLNTVHLFVG